MTLNQLHKHYKFACNEYVTRFGLKQNIDFVYWIGNEVGGMAVFNDEYFFNLSDIILDLTTKQKKGLILKWHDDQVEHNLDMIEPQNINYKSYTLGLRHEHLNENL